MVPAQGVATLVALIGDKGGTNCGKDKGAEPNQAGNWGAVYPRGNQKMPMQTDLKNEIRI
jgi:hypothetical protein